MTATTESDPVVIVDGARTPMGSFQGTLKDITATALGAVAIEGALKRSGIPGEDVDEVIMGCVLPAGLGQAPARQAAHGAGIPWDAGCTTVNKMCGSGMKATMARADTANTPEASPGLKPRDSRMETWWKKIAVIVSDRVATSRMRTT